MGKLPSDEGDDFCSTLSSALEGHGEVTVEDSSGVRIYSFLYDGVYMWVDSLDGMHINEFLCSRDNAIRMFGLEFDTLTRVPSLPVTVCGTRPDDSLILRARLEDHTMPADGLRDVLESLMKMYGIFTDWTVEVRKRNSRDYCCPSYEFQYF